MKNVSTCEVSAINKFVLRRSFYFDFLFNVQLLKNKMMILLQQKTPNLGVLIKIFIQLFFSGILSSITKIVSVFKTVAFLTSKPVHRTPKSDG